MLCRRKDKKLKIDLKMLSRKRKRQAQQSSWLELNKGGCRRRIEQVEDLNYSQERT